MRSKSAENAKLQFEAGQDFIEMRSLTDSGDHKIFESPDTLWSGAAGKEPVVRPDGLVSGGGVSPPASKAENAVDIASLTCYLGGRLISVSASNDFAITRPTSDVAKIISITVDESGSLTEVEGTDATDTNFVQERGEAGGPPYIPVGSIEISQVRLTSSTAAEIASSEIFQVPGTHLERYDSPLWDENWTRGEVVFNASLQPIHTGDLAKGVYAEYYTPIFADVPNASDFVPPENSHSVSSEQVYGGTVGSISTSLGQGSFNTRLQNGVDDPIILAKNDTRWFKFYPDRLITSKYIVSQGKLGIARTYPTSGSMQAACTISATEESGNITS